MACPSFQCDDPPVASEGKNQQLCIPNSGFAPNLRKTLQPPQQPLKVSSQQQNLLKAQYPPGSSLRALHLVKGRSFLAKPLAS